MRHEEWRKQQIEVKDVGYCPECGSIASEDKTAWLASGFNILYELTKVLSGKVLKGEHVDQEIMDFMEVQSKQLREE